MSDALESEFHTEMLTIYRRAKEEARYTATFFLQMVIEHGGLQAARQLINKNVVSDGYTALWERGRLDLTLEAMLTRSPRYHRLFTSEELEICKRRLREYGYELAERQ